MDNINTGPWSRMVIVASQAYHHKHHHHEVSGEIHILISCNRMNNDGPYLLTSLCSRLL